MTDPSDAPATGSDYVLSALEREGTTRLFGFVGEGNGHLIDRTNDHPIEYTWARHEAVAVTMADGYARQSGDVGVCTVTHGPGATNAATGLAAADRDNVPLVVLVGDAGRPDAETALQYLDHRAFADPIAEAAMRVETPEDLPGTLSRAFDTARTRHGPVVVSLPTDVQEAPAPGRPYDPIDRTPQRVAPDEERVAEAVALLEDATSPAILVGGGAMDSGAAGVVERLAERIGAPIATTLFGAGLLPDSHPLVTGVAGTFMTPASDALLWDADVLLAVGTRLSGKASRYGDLYADADVIQVDLDPGARSHDVDPAVRVVGDAAVTLDALVDRLPADPERGDRVRERIREAGQPSEIDFETDPDRIDPRELTVEVARRVPDDALLAVDSGNNTGFPAVYHPLGEGGRWFVNGNFGTMGYALPAAIGVQIAAPDRTVVCYTGDGALLQVVQAIETASRLETPVIVVVYNDESYGIIRHRQNETFDRETAATYEGPDLTAVAEGFGAEAATVRSVDDLDALDSFLENDPATPLVLDARTIPDVARPGFPPY